jgi:hypothetical protein
MSAAGFKKRRLAESKTSSDWNNLRWMIDEGANACLRPVCFRVPEFSGKVF